MSQSVNKFGTKKRAIECQLVLRDVSFIGKDSRWRPIFFLANLTLPVTSRNVKYKPRKMPAVVKNESILDITNDCNFYKFYYLCCLFDFRFWDDDGHILSEFIALEKNITKRIGRFPSCLIEHIQVGLSNVKPAFYPNLWYERSGSNLKPCRWRVPHVLQMEFKRNVCAIYVVCQVAAIIFQKLKSGSSG
jgi:hypothetical protein